MGTIFRRELSAYFNSAIAYIFLIVFVMFSNGLFMLQFFQGGKADMRPFFLSLPFVLNMFIPAIAMRLWAEDKRGTTFELLLTFPLKPHELVLGKYLASLAFYLLALASTLTIPIMLSWSGPMDLGPILGGYMGMAFLGALFLAVGIFLSGLCRDQITAFILTVVASFAIYFLGTDAFAVVTDGWLPGFGTFLKSHVGAASHLNGFPAGVVDMRNVLYFLFGSAAFLFLNGLSFEGRYRPKAQWVFSGAVAVCLAGFVVLNFLLHDMPLGRFDLTQGQVNKVSDVSKKILANLKAPAQLTLYITPSENMPSLLKTLEQGVRDKIEELRIASDGKLKFRVVHLENASQDEDALLKLRNEGVVPFQVESVQRDEVGVKVIYSSLVIEYKEKPQEVLPRLLPQMLGDLEYQLLSRLNKLVMDEKPIVAVFAPIPKSEDEMAPREDTFKSAATLPQGNGYESERIELTKESDIPEGAKLLMLFAPGEMTDDQRERVEKFLSGGGTVVIAEQPNTFTFHNGQEGMRAQSKSRTMDINKLLEKWGIKISDQILMDLNSQVISLSSGQSIGPFAIQMPVKFPNQVIVVGDSINYEAPIMKRVPSLVYLWGSTLELTESKLKEAGLHPTVLFTSSPKSWTMANPGSLTEANSQPPKELKGKFPLAALIEGKFSKDAAKPGRLLVIGCSQAFNEDLLRTPGNLNFYANIVDGFVLGEGLIEIRSKAAMVRDLRPLSGSEKIWYRFFTVFLIPCILLMIALFRAFIRHKEKELYLAGQRNA